MSFLLYCTLIISDLHIGELLSQLLLSDKLNLDCALICVTGGGLTIRDNVVKKLQHSSRRTCRNTLQILHMRH
jgi:hypothetical protein